MTETVAVFTKYFVDVEESLGRIEKIQNISHIYQRLFFFVTYLRPQKREQRKFKLWQMIGNLTSLAKLLSLFFCFEWEELNHLRFTLDIV